MRTSLLVDMSDIFAVSKRSRDLFYSSMVRHTGTEKTVMKEEVNSYRSLEIGGLEHHTEPRGDAPGSFRRQVDKGKCRQKP